MPYRRLPNTDKARINSLQLAISKDGYQENGKLVLSYRTIQEASTFLNKFKRAQQQYQQCYDLQAKAGKKYRTYLRTARLYVSHFIQVLNMAILRGELRKEIKKAYGLDPEDFSNPDLTTEQALQEWGEKIINGEDKRIAKGGVPIYNPTIAKVKVHFNIFSEHYFNQKVLQNATNKALERITKMRPMADLLILDIWNRVEEVYNDLPTEEKLEKCKAFGLIYYYRTSEKAREKAAKLQNAINFSIQDHNHATD